LDFAFKSNDDPASPYYHKLDTTKVAAMGHSQGGSATVTVASDARVKTVILFNGGSSPSKPYLTISGDRDIGSRTAGDLKTEVNRATKAAFLFYHMVPGSGSSDGHLTLMIQPERVIMPTVAWLRYLLNDDAASKDYFVGTTCKLCGHDAEYEFGQKGL
jgi:pimeloyl-ACP methyl ester carboxylesterase